MFSRNGKTKVVLAFLLAPAAIVAADIDWSGSVQFQPFLDSRQVAGLFDNLIMTAPAEKCYDSEGRDMNAKVMFSLNTWSSFLEVNVTGTTFRGFQPTANIAFNFVGAMPCAGGMGQAQLDSAYVKLDDVIDDYHHILFGYDAHPIQPGLTQPQVIGVGFGAPVAIFLSQPQLRYKFTAGHCESKFGLMVAALSQGQLHASNGPQGTTTQYIRNAIVPNLYFQLDYERKKDGQDVALFGAGVDYKRLVPRVANGSCNAACLACCKDMADTGGLKCCTATSSISGGECCQAILPCNTGCNPCNVCFEGSCPTSGELSGCDISSNNCDVSSNNCNITRSNCNISTNDCSIATDCNFSSTRCLQPNCRKEKEHVDSVSATIFGFREWDSVTLRTQFLYTQNLAEAYGMTGYAVTSIDPLTDHREYAPTQAVSGWFDLASSKRNIVPGIFAGFTKTLGTTKKICAFDSCGQPIVYGYIMNADYQVRVAPRVVFNMSDFSVGLEFEFTGMAYGSLDDHARVKNAKFVANYRTILNMQYSFQ